MGTFSSWINSLIESTTPDGDTDYTYIRTPAGSRKVKLDNLPGGDGVDLGETSSTAYRGDRGKTAFDHSQLAASNPHNVSDANLVTTDITTGNATAAKHGFLPKLSGVDTEFLNGDGDFEVPPSSGGDYIASSDYADVDELLTAMGSSALPAILNDTKDAAAAKVFPATAQIKPGGGKFTQSASGTLTFQGPGIVGDTHEHIIEGYAAEEIQWTGKYPQFFRPEWFGMVSGDSSAPVRAANSAAWVVLMAALRSGDTDGIGGNWDPYLAGADIHFSKANYYVDTVLQVNTQCRIYIPHGCQIIAGSNASAFRTNGQLTRDEGALDAADRTGAEGTVFYGGGAIRGTAGAATHNITLNVLTVTKLSGVDFNYQEGFLDGYTFTDTRNSISYVIIGNPASTTSLTIRPYKLYLTKSAPNTYTNSVMNAPTTWDGATIVINGVTTTITDVPNSSTIVTADDVALPGPAICTITSFPVANFTAFDARFNRFSGIDCRTRTNIKEATISGFPGHGLGFDSVRNPSTAHGTQPNQNNSVVENVHCIGNYAAGSYSKAVNANNITFINLDTQNNRIGVYDAPQHANVYVALHCALDTECVIQKDSIQGSHFVKPYLEEGTPNWDCVNAVIGPGTYAQGTGGGIQQYAQEGYLTGALIDSRIITSALGTVAALVKLVVRLGTGWNGFFQFGQVVNSIVVKSYHLLHFHAGLYSLAYYSNDSSSNPTTAAHEPVIYLSTEDHAMGGGRLGLPKGFWGLRWIVAKTAAFTLDLLETNKTFTNEGATARVDFTLPAAVVGYAYRFYVADADGIRVIAAAGDTIRIAGNVSAAAGRIDSVTIGDSVTLECINATEWVAVDVVNAAGWTVT